MNADMNLDGGILSGGLCVEFARLELGEIHCRGAFEALFAVDCGVDLVIRKYEPVAGWSVLQTFHFAELKKAFRVGHFGFTLGFAGGLEGLQ